MKNSSSIMTTLNRYSFIFLFYIIILFLPNNSAANINAVCPRIFDQVFEGFAPVGNKNAGNFSEFKAATALTPCILECCKLQQNCNAAFIFNRTCYHVKCTTNDLCLPLKRPNVTTKLQMVLVNPVGDGDDVRWLDILKKSYLSDFIDAAKEKENYLDKYDSATDLAYGNPYSEELTPNAGKRLFLDRNNLNGLERFVNDQYANEENDLQLEESKFYNLNSCEFGIESCQLNEECVLYIPESRKGVCNCVAHHHRNEDGKCVKILIENDLANVIAKKLLMKNVNNFNGESMNGDMAQASDQVPPKTKELTVRVNSKNLESPETETTLSAYTVPDEKSSGDKYSYFWTLLSQPNGATNGTIKDPTKDEVKLYNLSEGLYRFKVSVTGNGSYGEAYANVTVSPKKRINRPPQVVITPKEQTVKLPNGAAILDGSASKDDDQIVSWQWELVQGPISYQQTLESISTIQLSNLTLAGNYTFKLTVTDSDGAQNSTTATISVLREIDYPPEANAGPNVILYLPHNNVTLNGSLSSDDREIVAWEWTKETNDQTKAVDMQDTRTPYLKLSNLEEGFYTFVLKVMDANNQTSSASVHVLVKQPTNSPPTSNAGKNVTINLPQNWVGLNGSQSTDDIGISGYYWKQISGPTSSVIANANASIANATALTIGQYVFELTVIDSNANNASSRVYITIVQEKNAAPVANAGGDQSVTLPISVIILNGSRSSDDLGIVNYTWTRDGTSLAVGNVIENTIHEPVLMVTNVVAGRYVFRLTVTDDQGLTGSDTVSIIVRPDPLLLNLVELTLTMEATVLTQLELESLEQKLNLLLGDSIKFHLRDVKLEEKTKEAVIIFYVDRLNQDGKTDIVMGQEVEVILKEKFWRDASILGASVSDIRTTICQNTCSGHGACNSETRACLCETFWMPDVFYFWGVSEANCDWSILYVIIAVFIGFLFVSSICWGITCLCRRSYKPRSARSKPQKYALLGTHEDEIAHCKSQLQRGGGNTLSDSETDSDVLFESRGSKPNGILRNNNEMKNGGHKYSVTRLGRRIKT